LKELFNKLQGRPITDQFVHDAAKKVLLPPEEVRIWLEHLSTVLQNRRRGAAKAAATRKAQSTCVSDLQGAADPSTVTWKPAATVEAVGKSTRMKLRM